MPDCQSCKEIRKSVEPVPYIVHESAMSRNERIVKRLIMALLISFALWFATIGLFVWYLNQYDFESYEYTQNGRGVNVIGDSNGVDYNVSETEDSPED